jgi:hypothetical protein
MALRSQYLPGWDLRPVNGHGASGSAEASPTSEMPLCDATIYVPAGLKAGDTLSPSADVTSVDGKPIQGTIAEVWTLNGTQANSVTYLGKPVDIVLQLSCQGHAQEFHATYSNGKLTQGTNGPSDDNSGPPIWLVAGAGAAALAAAAAAIMRMRPKTPQKGGSPQPQPGPAGYILQTSAQLVEVGPGDRKTLDFRAWRVDAQGGYMPAPEAAISLAVAGQSAGLLVEPRSGYGQLQAVVTLTGPAQPGEVQVVANATTGDGGTQAMVAIRIVQHPVIELVLSDPGKRLREGGDPIWARARVLNDPADPKSVDPVLTGQIQFTVEGPNAGSVAPSGAASHDGCQWVQVGWAASSGSGPADGNPMLVARTVANGQPLRATVSLVIERDVRLAAFVNGGRRAAATFDAAAGGWDLPAISAYFQQAGADDQPVAPPIADWADRLRLEVDPPVVELVGIGERAPNQYEVSVHLAGGVDLESFFGKQLADREGVVSVRLSVTDPGAGAGWSASVEYQLRPRLELFAHPYPDPEHRFWQSATLSGGEFVTDSEDSLALVIGCCRADKAGPRRAGEIEVVPIDWWTVDSSVDCSGGILAAADLDVRDETDDGDLRVKSVRTLRPIVRQAGAGEAGLNFQLSTTLGTGIPSNYEPVSPSLKLAVQPHLLDLRTWIVPGMQRGSSELWALLFLAGRPDIPVPDAILSVHAEALSAGGPTLGDAGGSSDSATTTASDGTASLPLLYQGLNWTNWDQAVFRVDCRVTAKTGTQAASDPVSLDVNVADNVRRLLGELVDKNKSLHLANPYYDDPEWHLSTLLSASGWRNEIRGPIWNLCTSMSGQESASQSPDARTRWRSKFARDYVCSEYRDRIAHWLISRRNYQAGRAEQIATMAQMNGIEFDHFYLGGDLGALHNFEALFLAGMNPEDDPRAIDPWWKQTWNDPAYRGPDGLISSTWEQAYAAEFVAWANVLGLPVVAGLLLTGLGGTLAVVTAAVAEAVGAYTVLAGVSVNADSVYNGAKGYQFYSRGASSLPYVGIGTFVKDWLAANPNG